jgi:hypothetical protein
MKRHSTDLVSLIFGLIFLGVAGWWLIDRTVSISVPHAGWIAAGGLIVIGVLGVAGSLRGDRTAGRTDDRPDTPAPPIATPPAPPTPAYSDDSLYAPDPAPETSPTPEDSAFAPDNPLPPTSPHNQS